MPTLTFGFPDLRWRRSVLKMILQTQISICNCLAKTGGVVFVTNHFHIEEPPSFRRLNELLGSSKRKGQSDWMPRSIGIGSHNVRPGDSVILIARVFSPLIIRYDSDSTRLVSPAIVQGVMQGETWDTSWSMEDLEEFILS